MTFNDVTPNLVVSDLGRSLAFYRDVLGFQVVTTVPEQAPFVFAWMQRDTVSVFLNNEEVSKLKTQAGTNMLFITLQAADVQAGVDALYAQIKDRAPVTMELVTQFYGMREFAIKDPDGYTVIFAQPVR